MTFGSDDLRVQTGKAEIEIDAERTCRREGTSGGYSFFGVPWFLFGCSAVLSETAQENAWRSNSVGREFLSRFSSKRKKQASLSVVLKTPVLSNLFVADSQFLSYSQVCMQNGLAIQNSKKYPVLVEPNGHGIIRP
jgi:hypothetical protein